MNVTQKPHLHQDWIDPHAVGIVRALQRAGHTTYLVGGCVRDLLLGMQPKDFDIATTARPEEVKRLIHRSYIIGKRFRLVLVRRDEVHFEVATFRRDLREDEVPPEDAPVGDNIFGSPEEDARRRDFTINALFYDPINDQLIDFAEGLPDLQQGVIRMIGDPVKRLIEDPIRILRALRLKHMIGFVLDPELRQAMQTTAYTLPGTVLPRRREEILKLLRLRSPELAFREAFDLGLLQYISPTLHAVIGGELGEDFLLRLRQVAEHRRATVADNPSELFGLLVHAYVRTVLQAEPGRAREALEDETFQRWMRDELGMFKYEQALATKALQVEPLLSRRKEFQKRGERRQRALITNDAFPLALRFAEIDYALSPNDLFYWNERYRSLQDENPMERVRHKRRRPRRRKSAKTQEVRS